MKKEIEDKNEVAVGLREYFLSSAEEACPPSFSKFARSLGMTLSELELLREDPEFDRIWLDCIEIRRDYLIDKALTRSCDPSFVKFILSGEAGTEEGDNEDREVNVTITVVEK